MIIKSMKFINKNDERQILSNINAIIKVQIERVVRLIEWNTEKKVLEKIK